MKIGPKVTEKYFGMPLGDSQSADEPYDPASKGDKGKDGIFKTGRGSQGGGSKPSRNPGRSGSVGMGSSAPKQIQRIRGR